MKLRKRTRVRMMEVGILGRQLEVYIDVMFLEILRITVQRRGLMPILYSELETKLKRSI